MEVSVQFKEKLSKIIAFNLDNLVRADKEINFASVKYELEYLLKLYGELSTIDLEYLPNITFTRIQDYLDPVVKLFERITNFSVLTSQELPVKERDNIINEIRRLYENAFNQLTPILAYSLKSKTDFNELERKATVKLKQIENEYEDTKIMLADYKKDVDETVKNVKQAAAEVGVTQHAVYFQKEADDNDKKSIIWLKATVFMSIATVVWGGITFLIHSSETDTTYIIQFALSKLIILSALYYCLIWCAKNYNAYKHNYIVNKHRQNALSTFETFVKAAGKDETTKNAILLQTTQSIFSNQNSGFIGKDSDVENPNKFIEIIKAAGVNGK
jgi:hypothetical protein